MCEWKLECKHFAFRNKFFFFPNDKKAIAFINFAPYVGVSEVWHVCIVIHFDTSGILKLWQHLHFICGITLESVHQ